MDRQTSGMDVRYSTDDYNRQAVDLVANGGRPAATVAAVVGLYPMFWPDGCGSMVPEVGNARWRRRPRGFRRFQRLTKRLRSPGCRGSVARCVWNATFSKVHFNLRRSTEVKFRVVEDCHNIWPIRELCPGSRHFACGTARVAYAP
jgi:hypothetical protein